MTRLAILFLLAGPLLAADFEQRYHDAYTLEIVDGKVSAASRAYLELLREKELPPRLRAQARFRFAVTCVLLGRADEARARLAALAADPQTPRELLPQVEEYRKALAGVKRGSELEKRMERLVFELGHGRDWRSAFREIQIVGRPALPYLRRLLEHPDALLQSRAFDLLCTFDEPGMADLLTLRRITGYSPVREYLARHPEETARLEKRLLEDEPLLRGAIEYVIEEVPHYTPALADAVAALDGMEEIAVNLQVADGGRLGRWIRGDREALAAQATLRYSKLLDAGNAGAEFFDPEVFGVFCRRMATMKLRSRRSAKGAATVESLEIFAAKMPTALLIEMLDELTGPRATAGNRHLVAAHISEPLRSRVPAKAELQALLSLVRRWPAAPFLASLLDNLPEAEAKALVRELYAREGVPVYAIDPERPEDLMLVREAFDVAPAAVRRELVAMLAEEVRERCDHSRAYAVAYMRALPGFVKQAGSEARVLLGQFVRLSQYLTPEESQAALLSLVSRAVEMKIVPLALELLYPIGARSAGTYDRDTAAPTLEAARKLVSPEMRRVLVDRLIDHLHHSAGRSPFAAFVRAHLDEATPQKRVLLAMTPNQIPPAELIVLLPEGFDSTLNLSMRDHHRTARALASGEHRWQPNVLAYVGRFGDRDSIRILLERVDAAHLGVLLSTSDNFEPAAAAEAFERLKEDPNCPPRDLSRLARFLAARRPTAALVPYAARLLESKDSELVTDGITIARLLGTEKLLPALARTLESLDAGVRNEGIEAIRSIEELRELKKEVRANIETR